LTNHSHVPFHGITAIIVGGSKGIGKATAFELVRLGSNICIIARTRDVLVAVQQDLNAIKFNQSQSIDILSADATNAGVIQPALDAYVREKGCDLLINCVGGATPHYAYDYTSSDFQKDMIRNYMSTVIPIMTVLPYLMKQGGHIVNISSIAGYSGLIGYTTYSPAKFAIVGLSEALRHELKPYKILVSVVYPPDTDTPGLKEEEKTKFDELKRLTAKAKLKQPEEVAKELVEGIQKKKFNIHIGSSRWIDKVKRHIPALYFWLIDRELQKAREKISKLAT
jgi:3-dehydrosphinganine reductase